MTGVATVPTGTVLAVSSQEEAALWAAFTANTSTNAREQLFNRYLPLARQLARRFRRGDIANAVEYDELFQLATTGLLEAIDRFKPELGIPFRYFGNRRIAGSILNGIAQHSEINHQISVRKRMARERIASLRPAAASPLTLSESIDLLSEIAAEIAIGLMVEQNGVYVAEEADPANNAYETLAWKQAVAHVTSELDGLPSREREIIRLHYHEGVTFDQLGRLFGVTKGRISQLHKAAIGLLRKRLLQSKAFRFEG
jgi:RNA polymerase sigma factor FliA